MKPEHEAAYEAARQILRDCASGKCRKMKSCDLSDGSRVCVDCWNAQVRAWKAARKLQLSDRPKCAACSKNACKWTVGHVGLCGRCKKKAERAAHRRFGGSILGLTVNYTKELVLDLVANG